MINKEYAATDVTNGTTLNVKVSAKRHTPDCKTVKMNGIAEDASHHQ